MTGMNGFDAIRRTLRTPLSIAFAFVATHNHFVLDRGGKVFKQSAPIIKLPADATEDDHLALLGLLNSSTACFWMKQVISQQGQQRSMGRGIRRAMGVLLRIHTGPGLQTFPVPRQTSHSTLARQLGSSLATGLQRLAPRCDRADEASTALAEAWTKRGRVRITIRDE